MFIPKILKIPDCKARFTQGRLALLRDIIKSFVVTIPFQNITTMGSVEWQKRRKPGIQQVLQACLRGSGGLCGHNNYFMKLQLESLGYETIAVPGVLRRTGIPSSHLALLVRIPYRRPRNQFVKEETESLYLVDVGCGIPIHEPVLISSKAQYKSRAGGLDFRYETTEDGNFQRINECGDALLGPRNPGYLSPQDYVVTLPVKGSEFSDTITDWKNFDTAFKEVYENPNSVFLHRGFYLFRYLNISESDFQVVWIRGTQLVIATRETRTETNFSSFKETKPYILKYFPMIDRDEVERAVFNYTNQVLPPPAASVS